MAMVAAVLLGLGILVAAIASLWLTVLAFQRSVLLGLACCFVPFVQLYFIFKEWQDTKTAFGLYVIGVVIAFGGGLASAFAAPGSPSLLPGNDPTRVQLAQVL